MKQEKNRGKNRKKREQLFNLFDFYVYTLCMMWKNIFKNFQNFHLNYLL